MFCEHVWELTTKEEARKQPGATLTPGRWISRNKGDNQPPNNRGRHVAAEVNREGAPNAGCDAATPPLVAETRLFSKYASTPTSKGKQAKLRMFSITKAYVNAEPTRTIFVKVLKDLGPAKTVVGRLVMCCYGTRDAEMLREEAVQSCFANTSSEEDRRLPASSATLGE